MMKALLTVLVILFCSVHASAQWEEINNGIYGAAISVCYSHGGVLYLGSNNGTMFISTDDAKHWTTSVIPGCTTAVGSIAVIGDVLMATVFQSGAGVFVSRDRGQTWEASTNGLTTNNATSLLVIDNKVFLGTWRGVFISTDSAQTWELSLHDTPAIKVSSMCQSGSDIFLTTTGSGIFRTTDLGATWSKTDTAEIGTKYYWNICSGNGKLYAVSLYGDFVTSTNNGQSWVNRPRPLEERFGSVYADGGLVYGGSSKGVIVSSNDGVSWSPLGQATLSQNARVRAHNNMLVATTAFGAGCYISTDKGQTWTSSSNGLNGVQIWSLIRTPGSLYAMSDRGSVFVSTNNGSSWQTQSVVQSPINTSMLVNNDFYLGLTTGVARSVDACSTWTVSASGLLNTACQSLCILNNKIFLGTYRDVYVSSDNGNTWTVSGADSTPQYTTALFNHNGNILAGTITGSISSSRDEGKTWQMVKPGTPNNNGLICFASSPTTLMAVSYGAGLYRSEDAGKNWKYLDQFTGYSAEVVTYKSGKWYAGTDASLFTSADNGETWNEFPIGSNDTYIFDVDIQDDYVYAGTNRGMYRIKQSVISDVESPRSLDPNVTFSCNYTNGTLRVCGSSACAHPNVLKISTLTGECVFAAPISADTETQSYSLTLVPGLYLAQIEGCISVSSKVYVSP